MTAGRVLYAALHLLDRQLQDRRGRLCGKVDDLELTRSPDTGELYVTALHTGPGNLWYRLGARRTGRWLQREAAHVTDSALADPGRIGFELVTEIGATIGLAADAADLSTAAAERWVRDHVIGHLPGAETDAPE